MIRLATGGLILLPLLGLLAGAAPAATDFQDIPFLQARINQVLEHEPTGAEIQWRNEATGNAGVIRVLKTYFPSPDAPCRDYERTTRRPGGGESLVRGTGCRDSSGRWGLKETEEREASAPEPRESGAPGGESATGSAAGSATGSAGGQAGQAGGQVGTQTQGGSQSWSRPPSQTQSQSGSQTQSQSQTQSGSQAQSQTGGAGQAGVLGQGQSGQSTSQSTGQSGQSTFVLPDQGEAEAAAPQSAPETPEPAAPAPREKAPSLPDIDMPTRSD